jgi:hypothetical protein
MPWLQAQTNALALATTGRSQTLAPARTSQPTAPTVQTSRSSVPARIIGLHILERGVQLMLEHL